MSLNSAGLVASFHATAFGQNLIRRPMNLLSRISKPAQTVPQEVAGRLIRCVIDGHYKPGEKLPSEPELCRSFQIGRNALREALKALSLIGLIREERGKGTFVRDRSEFLVRPLLFGLEDEFDLQSLIEVRQLIEVELAGLAAERASQTDITVIALWLDRIDNFAGLERSREYVTADIEFHFAIALAAHNPLLSRYLTLTRNLIHKWLPSQESSYPPGLQQGLSEHHEIFEPIRDGRPVEARRAMKRHLVGSADRLLAAIRSNKEVR
jgi:GntR family transcriptional repressor for pyruvate dehydrogenase complex